MEPEDEVIRLHQYAQRHAQSSASPFRYPGGKGFLTAYLAERISHLGVESPVYVEPYCGGAGAALNLLKDGVVGSIHLNDLDPRIYSAWRAMIEECPRFLDRIASTPVTIETWRECRKIIEAAGDGYDFEVGFAAFFLNRTSTAGIIQGSGPIGGYEQTGKWKVDVRYYADTMIRRVKWVGSMANSIRLTNLPALQFLSKHAESFDSAHTFYFVDPPYVHAGSRLYLDAMNTVLHRQLAETLKSGRLSNWVLTYDDHPLIRQLYNGFRISQLEVRYSLRNARRAREILIAS
ncbi:D12 class N6 adenine-specific DNA methyltransferase [Roseivivax marinus]|uniref:D12 class N6 adenine-specific DNA methyltransferase n=2 Tax=Roseivivax marinus TaxID=1379903 RepID=W4HEI8_9RHOB|nr:D12 class N6 adenine-specific DNA methyltransferase [Roseivivax marinus]